MMLKDKNAIVYGAAGAIGTAVSRAFAHAGARVFLAGRSLDPLTALANDIRSAGGMAEVSQVDALDAEGVESHASAVVKGFGSIDVSFNLISIPHIHGRPLVEMQPGDFYEPLQNFAATHVLTATAAARRMAERKSGVILMMTTQPARLAIPLTGPFGAACAMIEAFSRSLAAEVGPCGVRVATLLSTGSPEAPGVEAAFGLHAAASGGTAAQVQADFEKQTLLKRLTTLREVADVATFLASDKASAITATSINLTCGLIAG